ncbi:MAG: T9SS type A sorting domain-containing protein [Sphingobacteriales bacterium]|nr:MAG: T9SS type A sorting domain-containing protein [Sphingobacteriales bacterium]
MKRRFQILSVFVAMGTAVPAFAQSMWQHAGKDIAPNGKQNLHPTRYTVFATDANTLKQKMQDVPANPQQAVAIVLPMPDGKMRAFHMWATQMMETALAARYPEIKTFTATADDNKGVTAKLDLTTHGFHAMVYDGSNTMFVDPLTDGDSRYYISYYKKDYPQDASTVSVCELNDATKEELLQGKMDVEPGTPGVNPRVNGVTKKTYRLALATTYEYSVAVDGSVPTKPGVLSAMVTSMNRVNGVYERELAVTMTLIGNTDTLISLTSTDPYSNNSSFALLGENQDNVDAKIGTANYDIGHVFSTGGGGVASPAAVCNSMRKAQGVTGRSNPVGDPFDIDYVAHEMGHQFGADHTFNASTGSCGGNNGVADCAYEPGSGTTILAYAGICGVNNIQSNSDAYFHYRSLEQMSIFIASGPTCGVSAVSGNTPAVIPAIAATYDIPFKTPFELTAPVVTDVAHDEINYCWDEHDLGEFGEDYSTTTLGPILRSFTPDTSRTRIFPRLEKLLVNQTSYLGEKLPEVERAMKFRLTVRDILNGMGCVNLTDDEVTVNILDTGVPFEVETPNELTDYMQAGSTSTVTWEVASTNLAPISTLNVDIFLSVDGGRTYPYTVATGVPNNGSANITVPNVATDSARIKVKGTGNVFFDISNHNFYINTWPTNVTTVGGADNSISMYPVPASNVLNIDCKQKDVVTASILNALGQQVWKGAVSDKVQVPVSAWTSGVYHARFFNKENKQIAAKQFVVQ